MLHLMPAGRAQRQFIGRRHMPGEVGNIHGQPCEYGMGEHVNHPVQGRRAEERAQAVAQCRLRQPSQQRNGRRAQKQQRRHHRHQYQMLCHMGDEQQAVQGVEWRSDRDPQREEAAEKATCAPGREDERPGTANSAPASEIEQSSREQSRCGPKGKGPGTPCGL